MYIFLRILPAADFKMHVYSQDGFLLFQAEMMIIH